MNMKRKGDYSEFVGVKMSKALRRELERLADADRRGLSDYIRLALESRVNEARKGRKRP